jgi:ATP-dependent DNA helicase DinG
MRIDSPFNYARQAALYVPKGFPSPTHAGHSEAVAALVAGAAPVLGGRTMVLTTTIRAMRAIADSLGAQLQGKPLRVSCQGDAPKHSLLTQFENAFRDADGPGVVLVASVSFWEGVDVAGEALQLLVIDKLPFSPPDDPVLQARAARVQSAGGNAFKTLHLPQATVALRQGAGRLIRQESDRGVLVVCDPRLTDAGYGRRMLDGLPPMRRLVSGEEFLEALRALTTTSTMERHPSLRLCSETLTAGSSSP